VGITLSHPQIYFFPSKFNLISLKFYFSLPSNLIYFCYPQISSSHLKSLFYPQIEPSFPQKSSSHLKSILYPQNLILFYFPQIFYFLESKLFYGKWQFPDCGEKNKKVFCHFLFRSFYNWISLINCFFVWISQIFIWISHLPLVHVSSYM
jgi:hypothetical protein